MKYENFEELPAWQDAVTLAAKAFDLTRAPSFRGQGDVANQLQRAALSVSNNVAEGFERGTTPELITFLYYAKGSAGEVRSICHVMERLPSFEHLASQISDIRSLARSVSKQLAAWAFSLQETDIKGSRHLTKRGRQTYHASKRASAFLEKLNAENAKRLKRRNVERRDPTKSEI